MKLLVFSCFFISTCPLLGSLADNLQNFTGSLQEVVGTLRPISAKEAEKNRTQESVLKKFETLQQHFVSRDEKLEQSYNQLMDALNSDKNIAQAWNAFKLEYAALDMYTSIQELADFAKQIDDSQYFASVVEWVVARQRDLLSKIMSINTMYPVQKLATRIPEYTNLSAEIIQFDMYMAFLEQYMLPILTKNNYKPLEQDVKKQYNQLLEPIYGNKKDKTLGIIELLNKIFEGTPPEQHPYEERLILRIQLLDSLFKELSQSFDYLIFSYKFIRNSQALEQLMNINEKVNTILSDLYTALARDPDALPEISKKFTVSVQGQLIPFIIYWTIERQELLKNIRNIQEKADALSKMLEVHKKQLK